jgi:uncharacterized RDD family membrane protein YckC
MAPEGKAPALASPSIAPPRQTPPSIRRRLVAMLYESLLLLGVLGVAFILPHLLLGMIDDIAVPGALLWLHLFLVLMAYFVWYWRRNGQTLAMQTWKIKLVGADGAPVTRQQALLRYALVWPSLLLGGIGLLWALFDRDRQFLHDRLAGTMLIFSAQRPTGC